MLGDGDPIGLEAGEVDRPLLPPVLELLKKLGLAFLALFFVFGIPATITDLCSKC
jgi:hypothetical protein